VRAAAGLGLPADDRTPTASFCLDEQSDRHSNLADVRADCSCIPAPASYPPIGTRGYPFGDPLMEPYVLLEGLQSGAIGPEDFPR
jgi:hypothetical protein